MYCPQCHVDDNHVIDSRFSEKMNSARRRRECKYCGYRFTTYEIVGSDFDKIRDVLKEELKISFVNIIKKRVQMALDYDIDITELTTEPYREAKEQEIQ